MLAYRYYRIPKKLLEAALPEVRLPLMPSSTDVASLPLWLTNIYQCSPCDTDCRQTGPAIVQVDEADLENSAEGDNTMADANLASQTDQRRSSHEQASASGREERSPEEAACGALTTLWMTGW